MMDSSVILCSGIRQKMKEAPVLTEQFFNCYMSETGVFLSIQAFFPEQILIFWQEIPCENIEIVLDMIQRC